MHNKEWEKMFEEEFNDIFHIPAISLIRNPSIEQSIRFIESIKTKWMSQEVINVKITLEGKYSKTFQIRDVLKDIVNVDNGIKLCGHNLTDIIEINKEMKVFNMKYYTYDKLNNGKRNTRDSAKREICIVLRLRDKKVYTVCLTHWEHAEI